MSPAPDIYSMAGLSRNDNSSKFSRLQTRAEPTWSEATFGAAQYGAMDISSSVLRRASKLIPGDEDFLQTSGNWFEDWKKRNSHLAPMAVDSAWDLLTTPKALAGVTASQVGYFGGLLAASALGFLVGGEGALGAGIAVAGSTLLTYAVEGQSAYDEAISSGASKREAEIAANTIGPISAGIEMLQFTRVLRFAGKAKSTVIKAAVKNAERGIKNLTTAGSKLTPEAVRLVAMEGLQEALQGTVQEGGAYAVYGKPIEPGFIDRRLQEAIGVAPSVLLFGGAGRMIPDSKLKDFMTGKDMNVTEELGPIKSVNREKIRTMFIEQGVKVEDIDKGLRVHDAIARTLGAREGLSADEYYDQKFAFDVEKGLTTSDVLAQKTSDVGEYVDVLHGALYDREFVRAFNKTGSLPSGRVSKALQSQGVRKEQLVWTGISEILKNNEFVKLEDLQEAAKQNEIELVNTVLGGIQNEKHRELKAKNESLIKDTQKLQEKQNELDAAFVEAQARDDGGAMDQISAQMDALDEMAMQIGEAYRETRNQIFNLAARDATFEQHSVPGPHEDYGELLVRLPKAGTDEAIALRANTDYTITENVQSDGRTTFDVLDANNDEWIQAFNSYTDAQQFIDDKMSEVKKDAGAQFAENTGAHFQEPFVMVHARFDTRTDSQGRKVLFVHEIQSDAANRVRKSRSNIRDMENEVASGKVEKLGNSYVAKIQMKATMDEDGKPYDTPKLVDAYVDSNDVILVGPPRTNAEFATREQAQMHLDNHAAMLQDEIGVLDNLNKEIEEDFPYTDDAYNVGLRAVLQYGAQNGFEAIVLTDAHSIAKKVGQAIKENKNMPTGFEATNEGFVKLYKEIIPRGMLKQARRFDTNAKLSESLIEVGEDTSVLEVVSESRADTGEEIFAVANKETGAIVDAGFATREEAEASIGESTEIQAPYISLDISKELRENTRTLPMFQSDKGSVMFLEDGRAVIKAFEGADVSTMLHELFHVARRNIVNKEDLKTLETFFKVKDGKWEVSSEEAAARAFERYIGEGKAPTAGLQKVFESLKRAIVGIYKNSLANIPLADKPISREVTAVFDRMIHEDSSSITQVRAELDEHDAIGLRIDQRIASVKKTLKEKLQSSKQMNLFNREDVDENREVSGSIKPIKVFRAVGEHDDSPTAMLHYGTEEAATKSSNKGKRKVVSGTIRIERPALLIDSKRAHDKDPVALAQDLVVGNNPKIDANFAKAIQQVKNKEGVEKAFEVLREALISKGYDGIIYENANEGGTSYITMSPKQFVKGGETLQTKLPNLTKELKQAQLESTELQELEKAKAQNDHHIAIKEAKLEGLQKRLYEDEISEIDNAQSEEVVMEMIRGLEAEDLKEKKGVVNYFKDSISQYLGSHSAPLMRRKSGRAFLQILQDQTAYANGITGRLWNDILSSYQKLTHQDTKWLKHVDDDVTNMRRMLDSTGVRDVIDLAVEVHEGRMDQAQADRLAEWRDATWKVFEEIGIEAKDIGVLRKMEDGRVVTFQPSKHGKLPRIVIDTAWRAIADGSGPLYDAIVVAVEKHNPGVNLSRDQIKTHLQNWLGDRKKVRNGSLEEVRKIQYMPDHVMLNGRKVAIFHTEPFYMMTRAVDLQVRKIADVKFFGQDDKLLAVTTRELKDLAKNLDVIPVLSKEQARLLRRNLLIKRLNSYIVSDTYNQMTDKELSAYAKKAGIAQDVGREYYLDLLLKVNPKNLTKAQQNKIYAKAKALGGIETKIQAYKENKAGEVVKRDSKRPIDEVFNELLIREGYNNNHAMDKIRALYVREGGLGEDLDDIYRIHQGIPYKWLKRTPLTRTLNVASQAIGAAQVSLMVIPNLVQTLAQVPRYGGWVKFAQAWKDQMLSPDMTRAQITATGAFRDSINHWTLERGYYPEGIARNLMQAISTATGARFVNDMNSTIAGRVGQLMIQDFRNHGAGGKDIRTLREMGLSEKEISMARKGKIAKQTEVKFITNMVAKTQYVTEEGHLRSKTENIPILRMLFAYSNYTFGSTRALARTFGDIKTMPAMVKAGDYGAFWGTFSRTLNMLVGSVGAGMAGMMLKQALKGQPQPLPEPGDEQWEGVLNRAMVGLMEVQFLGATQRVLDPFKYGDGVTEKVLIGAMPKVKFVADMLGMMLGYGKYGRFGIEKRSQEAFLKNTPLAGATAKWIDNLAYPRQQEFLQTQRVGAEFARNKLGRKDFIKGDVQINPEYYPVYEYLKRDAIDEAIMEAKRFYSTRMQDREFLQKALEQGQHPMKLAMRNLRQSLLARTPGGLNQQELIKFMTMADDETLQQAVRVMLRYRRLVDIVAP